ncbi:hypothetical protein LTR85_002215 [Meristemomyces frigidus]|nr:hypothetical protein LTR85_002215 [Meristemomyces frigidus]
MATHADDTNDARVVPAAHNKELSLTQGSTAPDANTIPPTAPETVMQSGQAQVPDANVALPSTEPESSETLLAAVDAQQAGPSDAKGAVQGAPDIKAEQMEGGTQSEPQGADAKAPSPSCSPPPEMRKKDGKKPARSSKGKQAIPTSDTKDEDEDQDAEAEEYGKLELAEGNSVVLDGEKITVLTVKFPKLGLDKRGKAIKAASGDSIGMMEYSSRGQVEVLKYAYNSSDTNLKKSALRKFKKSFSVKDDVKALPPCGHAAYVEYPEDSGDYYYLAYAGQIALWGDNKPFERNHINGYTDQNHVRTQKNAPLMLISVPRPPQKPAGPPITDIPAVLLSPFNKQATKARYSKNTASDANEGASSVGSARSKKRGRKAADADEDGTGAVRKRGNAKSSASSSRKRSKKHVEPAENSDGDVTDAKQEPVSDGELM